MTISDLLMKPIDDENLRGIANKNMVQNMVLSNPDFLNIIFRTCTYDLYPDSYLPSIWTNRRAYVYLRSLAPYDLVNKSWRGAVGKIKRDFIEKGLALFPVRKNEIESLFNFINSERVGTLHFLGLENKEMETITIENFVSQLTGLHINDCSRNGKEHLIKIARLTNLTTLTFGKTAYIADNGVIPIVKQLTKLTSLSLGQTFITKNTLAAIENLPNLKELTFSQATFEENPVIFPFTNLTSLALGNCKELLNLTQSIPQLTNLTFLRVFGSCISQGITNLDNLKNLTCLDISACDQIQNENLAKITALSELKYLTLSGNDIPITDWNISQIAATLPNLTYLDLSSSSQFSDNSLLSITKKLTNLTHLNVTGCTQLSAKCIITFTNLRNLSYLGVTNPLNLRTICSIPPGLEVGGHNQEAHKYWTPKYRRLY